MEADLTDNRIVIRPLRADDVDAVYEAVRESIKEVAPWLPWCHPDYSREETSAFISSLAEEANAAQDYGFAIVDAETNAFLGGIGINQINHIHRIGNLGYWVRTSCTRRGVAASAARQMARFGFRELGLLRLEIVVAIGNHASQRVAEKAGATREGILRKRLLIHGQSHDAVLYSLVAEDLED
ncbi:MAG TPA: GNAT family N-acetyltransferase [Pyrinomonadaceae bacterium]|jgi:RimJ/RimL family protein N-acetyltransferase